MKICPRIHPVVVAFSALLLPLVAAFGGSVTLDRTQPPSAAVTLISESPAETVLELRFGELSIDSAAIGRNMWTSVTVPGMSYTSRPGWPELPQISVWIRGAEDSRLEILSSDHTTRDWGRIIPAPDPLLRSSNHELSRTPATDFYSGSAIYPLDPASISQQANIRGTEVSLVTFVPVQFDMLTRRCIVHTRLRIRITHESLGPLDSNVPVNEASRTVLERLLMTNRDDAPAGSAASPRIILVTEPEFLGALQPLIEWKSRAGLPVLTLIYSQEASTPEQLRAHLVQLYDSLMVPPDYLLLAGDVSFIPAFSGVEGSLTDHPYSTLAGNDYLPDISVGRLPCHTAQECVNWVNRILAYERDGVLLAEPNATVFSSAWVRDPQHGITVRNLFQSAGLATDHLQEPQSGSLPALLNSLNAGREWVFYIGHGYAQGWTSVAPAFENTQLSNLQPSASSVVVSVACATADLQYPGGCMGQTWLSSPTGPLAYFSATEPTPFFYSDTLGLGAMRAVFAQHVDRLGLAADLGRLATAQAFPQPAGGLTEETIQQFMLLGDPSMQVFTTTPHPLEVSYSHTLPVGASQVALIVQRDGSAVSNATVCVSSAEADYYDVRSTDASGSATVPLSLPAPAVLNVTVMAQNAVPYLGTLNVVPAQGAFVQLADALVIDSAGDSDGQADRGENCVLRLAVTNLGNAASDAGSAYAGSLDTRITFGSGETGLPSISAGDTLWLDGGFPFVVSDTVADLSSAVVRIGLIPTGQDSVMTYRTVTLHGPALSSVGSSVVSDSAGGTGNLLKIWMRNVGTDQLAPAQVRLTSHSPLVGIADSVQSIATVAEGDTLSAIFPLNVSAEVTPGYPFAFTCQVSSGNLPAEFHEDTLRLAQVPCFLYGYGRQSQEIDAVAASLASLGIEYERDTLLPADLNRYASIWTFCGMFPNQRVLSAADGQRLADYVTAGGNCYLEGGDTWAFDPPTALHSLFHINGVEDGTSNAGPFVGEYGTRYQDYGFEYGGENSFVDQLAPGTGATVMLHNDRPNADYPVCIAYAGSNYRTVGSSVELGAVDDAAFPSTRVHLVSDILDWFGIAARADIYPPQIQHRPVTRVSRPSHPFSVIADLQDASGISTANVAYRVNREPPVTVAMTMQDGRYRASLPGGLAGDTVTYRIHAEDATALHTWAETAEFSCVVGLGAMEPGESDLPGMDRWELRGHIHSPDNCSWSMVNYPDSARMLELHGAQGQTISFTTPEFDCSGLQTVEISFNHYLRVNGNYPNSLVRVLGSPDGGVTFPVTVWEFSSAAGYAFECPVVVHNQEWAAGKSDVVLRFEFQNDWYWRLADISVTEDKMSTTEPVVGLTISVENEAVRLRWPSNPRAGSYLISASEGADDVNGFMPMASTEDTSFVDREAASRSLRLYRVEAIIGESADAPRPASLRTPDVNWNRKLERVSY